MQRLWHHALYVVRDNLLTCAVCALLLGLVGGAIWGPWLAPHDPLPTPEWGIMVAEGATFIVSGEWWLALFPGAALLVFYQFRQLFYAVSPLPAHSWDFSDSFSGPPL